MVMSLVYSFLAHPVYNVAKVRVKWSGADLEGDKEMHPTATIQLFLLVKYRQSVAYLIYLLVV